MMTMHASKGLEFGNVFIVGFEENVFPGTRAINSLDPIDLEEERRLAYVAITRAKKQLYLTSAEKRMIFGTTMHNGCSRFLREIDTDLIDKQGVRSSSVPEKITESKAGSMSLQQQLARSKPAEKNRTIFSAGDRVSHNIFGEGTVLSVTKMGNDSLMEIAFDKVGTKKLMANFARIKKTGE